MTTPQTLPTAIHALIEKGYTSDNTLNEAMQIIGEGLSADRCFLYVRQPNQERGRIAFCWRKDGQIDQVFQPDWIADTTDRSQTDPMNRISLDSKEPVYVDDVKTSGPGVLNQAFSQDTFGHRAFIQAPIQAYGQLWGILVPSIFGESHSWTNDEKSQIEAILPRLQPMIEEFVGLDTPNTSAD